MKDEIKYGALLNDALRGMLRRLLQSIEQAGALPDEHHFYITFQTGHKNTDIPSWLCKEFPDEMTIVIQNWYDGLQVNEDGFHITLNFSGKAEALYIPFKAITAFVDPHVQFSLHLEDLENITQAATSQLASRCMQEETETLDNIIPLDRFRKT